MPRLFWKFFTTIWLTLAATVTTVILIVNLLQAPSFAPELDRQKREIILSLTANILRKDGEAAAQRLVHTSEDMMPLGLTMSKVTDTGACAGATAETRIILKDEVCYRISVSKGTRLIRGCHSLMMP